LTIRQRTLRLELGLIGVLTLGIPLVAVRTPWTLGLFLLALVGGGWALWQMHLANLGLVRRIQDLRILAERQATGDLTDRPALKVGGDELDDLLMAMDKMANHISGILSEIRSASSSLGDSVGAFKESFDDISNSMVHVAGAMGGMAEAIHSVESKCVEEDREASQARQRAQRTSELMSRLEDSALEIGRIVEVIGTISKHTNLLALNASIEAVRAGDAGKGFVVVASEVKELANQTRSATVEIQNKVAVVRSDVLQAVEGMGEIGQAIEAINSLSGGIVTALVGGNGSTPVSQHIQTADHSVNMASERMDQLGQMLRGIDATSSRLKSLMDGFKVSKRVVKLTPDLLTGINAMDSQHSRLFDLIDQLGDALQNGRSEEALRKILPELADYTVMHFSEEERMMEERKIPGLDAHKLIHRAFVSKVQTTMADMASGKPVIATSLVNFLQDWLVQHIGGTDRKYAVRH